MVWSLMATLTFIITATTTGLLTAEKEFMTTPPSPHQDVSISSESIQLVRDVRQLSSR